MGEVKEMNQNEEVKKLSYEELENVATQLQSQCQRLYSELTAVTNTFKRLDYLFKVVKNNTVFPTEFVDKCVAEIELIMSPQPEETTEEA